MKTNKNITDIFPIINTNELTGEYRLFKIFGLEIDSKEFQRNKQYIIKSLSRKLKHPIEIIVKDSQAFVVTKNEKKILDNFPKDYPAIGNNTLYFKETNEVFSLDFNSRNPSVRRICKRFLQFSIQGTLFNNNRIWQPGTGKPFFSKKPNTKNGVAIFPGFIIRVVDLKEGGWGIIVDATRKYLKPIPLPTYITKEKFDKKYKNRKVIYKLGHQWYEIKLTQWHSLTVSEHKYPHPNGKGNIYLIDDLRERCSKPHPQVLANLPSDASVLFYHSSSGEARSVPSGLCFLVLGTEDEMDGHVHQNSILNPDIRLDEYFEVREKLLQGLKFGEKSIKISSKLLTVPKNKFDFPDILVGDNEVFKYEDNYSKPKRFAKARAEKILSKETGFFKPIQTILGPQYIFLPRSIFDTFKDDFVNRIVKEVNKMYPWYNYNPKVEYFEDIPTKHTHYVSLGKKIISEIKKKYNSSIPSHALVMIPSTTKGKRQHDKLAALVVRELKKMNITGSVIHTTTVLECYEERIGSKSETYYSVKYNKQGKFRGYIQNVALTKILLKNRKYPFALSTPLNADLTIGIDVKNNLSGFLYIDKYGKNIRPEFVSTTKKEKLPRKIIFKQLYETIKDEAQHINLKNIVIHRDGRIFESEQEGIRLAIEKLKKEGILSEEANISIVEIPKSSFSSFRIFDKDANVSKYGANDLNPEIGTYYFLNNEIGYVCTTGKEFLRNGTTKPLQIKFISGTMSFEKILQDIFFLSTLTFTKLDGCSRLPLTIKILDIFLRGLASKYDEEELDYLEYSDYEELDNLKQELNLN